MARLILRRGDHDPDRRCSDCAHMRGYVSWWCTSPEAKEYRGTSIPGVCECPFWKPCSKWEDLGIVRRLAITLNPVEYVQVSNERKPISP